MNLSIPNFLSLTRMGLIPLFVIAVLGTASLCTSLPWATRIFAMR